MSRRVCKILDHLKPATSTHKVCNVGKVSFPAWNDIIFDDYCIRLMKPNDYDDIWEICQTVYGGNDYVHVSFYRLLHDSKCIFFAVEHIPTKKVVLCHILKLLDNGKTWFSFGSRTHPDYRSKGIYSKYLRINMKWRKGISSPIRSKATTTSQNTHSLHLISKAKPNRNIANQYYFLCITQFDVNQLNWSTKKNDAYDQYSFQKRMNKYKCDVYSAKLKEIKNIGLVIDLLKEYGKKELYLDWKTYDLMIDNESVKECYNYLCNEWNDGRLTIYSCNNNAFGLWYNDERKYVTQLHLYGNNETDLLTLLNECFSFWKQRYQTRNDQSLWIFLDSDDTKNTKKLSKLLDGTGFVVTIQTKIDYKN